MTGTHQRREQDSNVVSALREILLEARRPARYQVLAHRAVHTPLEQTQVQVRTGKGFQILQEVAALRQRELLKRSHAQLQQHNVLLTGQRTSTHDQLMKSSQT